jgi:hypothetical protein
MWWDKPGTTGYLNNNSAGRYELEDGYYFTTGDDIDVLIDGQYIRTGVRHKTEVQQDRVIRDYYLKDYPDFPMQSLLVRIPFKDKAI